MKQFLRKQYIGVVVTGIVVIAIIIGFAALFFLMKERLALVQEVKQTLATYEQNKKTFAKETVQLQSLAERVQLLEQKRITEDSVPELLSKIEALGVQKEITVEVTSVQTPSVDGEKKLYLDISAQGDFEKLNNFSQSLLSQEYQIRFSKLSLYKDGQSAESAWQLLGTVEVVSF